MTNRLILFCATLVLTMAAASAHHNPNAHYIVGQSVEVEGVVTEFRGVNPHSRIYFDVANDSGEVEEWMAEGDSIINLRRAGWADDEIKPGDRIHIQGRPSRFGRNLVEWQIITRLDGSELGGGNGQQTERYRYMDGRLQEFRRQRDSAAGR
ncbi:MAG: DUF6152 family protein [Gammaproteobacteria bacterium]